MPFGGRVGAMPASDQGPGRGRNDAARKHKGITMADLKKQTALRLAQEQQQVQAVPPASNTAAVASDPRTHKPVVTPQTLAARRLASAPQTNSQAVGRDAAPAHYQRLHHHNPMAHNMPNTADAAPALVPTSYNSPGYYSDQQPQGGKNLRARHSRQGKPSPLQHAARSTAGAGRYHPNQQSQFLHSAPPPTLPAAAPTASFSAGYNTASSSQGGNSSSSSKLPHGLTVHELKEMTKARLQAEAAEKMSSGTPSTAPVADVEARDSSAFDSGHHSNYGRNIYQNQEFDRMSQGSDAHLVSTQAPMKPYNFDQRSQGQAVPAQVSPLPTSFQKYGAGSSSFGENSSMEQRTVPLANRNRVDSFPDSWENASVTSHNSTVASGSESAFSSGVGGGFAQLDEPSGISLARTQSYPLGNNRSVSSEMMSREGSTNSIPSQMGSGYFDSTGSLAQSRQRAMTLSPRPVLSLLHEDRPGFADEDLGVPAFSSSRHARQQLTARSTRGSFSPVLQHQMFNEPSTGPASNASNAIGGSLLDNRPRTSSAVSLPAFSNTAEEFALDGRNDPRGGMSGPYGSDNFGSQQDTGSSDAFVSSSSFYGRANAISQSSSSVFRHDLGHIPAPPGLGGPSRSANTNTIGDGSNRVRAATWVAGTVPGSDMFSSSGLYEYSGDDTLAGDLASILKLSGAEEKADGGRSGIFDDDIAGLF